MDKIVIARDESFVVTLREHESSRRYMIEFTQDMMCIVDDFANVTSQNIKQLLEKSRNAEDRELLNECADMMRRARYSIRDFQYIHDVGDNNFEEPVFKCVDIRSSLEEAVRACQDGASKLAIEIKSEVNSKVPRFIAVEENFMI